MKTTTFYTLKHQRIYQETFPQFSKSSWPAGSLDALLSQKTSAQDKPAGCQGCAAYNDFRELVARPDIDAICIATPDHWHAILTVAALKAGPWQVRTNTQDKDLCPEIHRC